jgi:serine/arginine repetitive matrix protein 1
MAMLKPWITNKIIEYLGFDDEVLINLVISELEQGAKQPGGLCPKKMQITLTGNYISIPPRLSFTQ